MSGFIKERSGAVIAGAIISVTDSIDNILKYTSSDAKGRFRLDCIGEKITFSYLGFSDVTIPLKDFSDGKVIYMDEEPFELKEVVVRVEPISSVGDTLTYNVSSFRNASDRSIEDVIKKLPGINVSEDGRISYNGESINKFYIEGLEVVGGRYAIATKNISPDDVSSVNIYENHQPKRVLKDIEFSNKAALNLKLKKKSMLRPVGYFKGEAGTNVDGDLNWLGEFYGMFIAPKHQSIATAKANDAGVSYINETRQLISEESSNTTSAYNIFPNMPFGTAKIPTSRYFDNKSYSASVNSIVRAGEYTTLSVNADYSDEDNRYNNNRTIIYANGYDSELSFIEDVKNDIHQREAKFRFNVENNATKHYISNKLTFIGHFNNNAYDVTRKSLISQFNKTTDYNLRDQLNTVIRISKSLIDFKTEIYFGRTPTSRLTAQNDNANILSQDIEGTTFATKSEFSYSWIINFYSYIGVKTMFTSSYDLFKSSIPTSMSENSDNDIKGYKLTTTAEPYYQYKPNDRLLFNLSAPINMYNIRVNNKIDDKTYPTNKVKMDIKGSSNYTTPFNMKVIYTIGYQNSLGGINDYITEPIYTTYLQKSCLGSGSLNSRHSFYTSTNISYRNTIDGMFASANVMYRRNKSNRISGLNISSDQIASTVVNSANSSNMLNCGASFTKRVFKWGTTFTLDAYYEANNKTVLRQNSKSDINLTSYIVHTAINSSPIKEYLNFIIDVNYTNSKQKLRDLNSTNSSNNLTCQLTVATHPFKSFEVSAKGYYNQTDIVNGTTKNSMFVDCGIKYSLRKVEFELTARNICNAKNYQYSYLLDSDIYYYSFGLRPMELLAGAKISF